MRRAVIAIQQRYVGASGCMSPAERRRLNRIQDELEARSWDPQNGWKDDRDPELARLAVRAEGLIAPYAPGGRRYDERCYERAWERFERRVARQE
jgi:hypothetical protein